MMREAPPDTDFERLLRRAADRGDQVILTPRRDPQTRELVFAAQIFTEGRPAEFDVNGKLVAQESARAK